MGCDSAPKESCEQHSAEDRGSWNQIKGDSRKLEKANPTEFPFGEPELVHPLIGEGRRVRELKRRAHYHCECGQDRKCPTCASSPSPLLRHAI